MAIVKLKSNIGNLSFEKTNIAASITSLEALQKNTNLIELVEKNKAK